MTVSALILWKTGRIDRDTVTLAALLDLVVVLAFTALEVAR